MRFIHFCLRSSPYSTPPVPPTFALAPCPGPSRRPKIRHGNCANQEATRPACPWAVPGTGRASATIPRAPHTKNIMESTLFLPYPMSGKDTVIESVAIIAATGTAASTAVGVTALARGESRGAPGMSKALSRLGQSVGGGRHADRRGRGGGDRCPGRLSAISRNSGRPVVAPAVSDASTRIAPSQTSCSCSAHEPVLSRLTATQTEQTYICKLGTGTVQEGVFFLCSDLPPKQRRSRVYPETTALPHRLARRIPFCFRIRQNDGVR